MARARSGGGGLGVALVIFGVLFVVALVLSILFYTKIEQAELAATNAEQALAKVATQRQIDQAADAVDDEVEAGTVLERVLETLRRRGDTIVKLENEAQIAARRDTAFKADISELQGQLQTAQAAASTAEEALDAAKAQFAPSLVKLQGSVKQAEEKNTGFASQISSALANVTSAMKQYDTQRTAELTERDAAVTQAEQRLATAQEMVARLEKDLAEMQQRITDESVKVDSRVVGMLNEGRAVILDIGERQGVRPGMTFQVFGPDDLIQLNDEDELRGKAVIEVYSTQAGTSEARVVSTEPRQNVGEGDKVVNVVFSPNTTYLFQVYGRFNVEGSNDPAVDDYNKIVSLIRQMGGDVMPRIEEQMQAQRDKLESDEARAQVQPDLSHEVYYLVLGEEPEYPSPLPTDQVVDPEDLKKYNTKLERYNAFQALKRQAQAMKIPILDQTRLLYLTGYYTK